MIDLKPFDNTLWLAEPAHLRRAVLRLAQIPVCPTAREVAKARRKRLDVAKQAAAGAIRSTTGRIGVIPVHGPIQQRYSSEMDKLGGTSCEEISAALDAMLADKSVTAIVFHCDSPGGNSYGVEELSDKIFAARGEKKTYAMVDSLCASACYWIGTAAEQMVITPGGECGSVGVYALHIDESKALEEEGLTVTPVSAGKYKTEFASFQPLSDDARQELQAQVDYTYDKFLKAVKRNRGVTLDQVRSDFGQGRCVNADDAVSRKMADRIMTFEELLGKLGGSAGGGTRQASAELLRLRHDRQKQMDAWTLAGR